VLSFEKPWLSARFCNVFNRNAGISMPVFKGFTDMFMDKGYVERCCLNHILLEIGPLNTSDANHV
jgi:hypothetical protein